MLVQICEILVVRHLHKCLSLDHLLWKCDMERSPAIDNTLDSDVSFKFIYYFFASGEP